MSDTIENFIFKDKKEIEKVKDFIFKIIKDEYINILSEKDFKTVLYFITVLEFKEEEKNIILEQIFKNKNFYQFYINCLFKNVKEKIDKSFEINLKLDILIKKFYKNLSE